MYYLCVKILNIVYNIIFLCNFIKEMKFKPNELERLLKASYEKDLHDLDNRFIIDKLLSDERVKVYTIVDMPDKLMVVHRGSQDTFDWHDNLTYLNDTDLKFSKSYKMHKKRHIKATSDEQYKDYYVYVFGHSCGDLYATQLCKEGLADEVIKYNKKPDISSLICNESASIDLIGDEIFVREINYKRLRKYQLKKFLKQNKLALKLDINLTGLNKKQLVEIVKKVIE